MAFIWLYSPSGLVWPTPNCEPIPNEVSSPNPFIIDYFGAGLLNGKRWEQIRFLASDLMVLIPVHYL